MNGLGTYTPGEPELLNTVNGINLWRLSAAAVTPAAFAPVGPMPWTGIYSRVDQILQLAAGAVIGFFDNVGMRLYEATLTAINTTTKEITINAPNAPNPNITLSYARADGSVGLPIAILQ